jgi:hypothetical protein
MYELRIPFSFLARDVVSTLTDISKQVPPRIIAPVEGLRRAMGIGDDQGVPDVPVVEI